MSSDSSQHISRRKLLIGASIGFTALAGCSGGGDGDGSTPTETSTSTPTPTTTEEPEPDFELQEIISNEMVHTGDKLEATVTVENIGDVAGTAIVKFSLGNLQSVSEKSIEAGSTRTVSHEFETGGLETGQNDLTVEIGDGTISKSIDVFAEPDSGVYGAMKSGANVSLEGEWAHFYGKKEGERDSRYIQLGEGGHFTFDHPFDPSYQGTLTFDKRRFGVFNGLPTIYRVFDGTITNTVKFIGQIEVPEAYRTEVQLVTPDGEPVSEFDALRIYTAESGYGLGPTAFTTDTEGYMIATESSRTGISVPAEGEEDLSIGATPKDGDTWFEEFGRIYGSEGGEEFTFTVEDPAEYESPSQ